ncbi:MAG: NAD(P)/FAD-dependent oxidoreductase [Leptospirales bacterium]
MKRVVIIGGGFAGFWSAMSAVRQSRVLDKTNVLQITMVSLDEYLSIRPRFYEDRLAEMRVPLKQYLDPLGIDFSVGKVISIDVREKHVVLVDPAGREESLFFDGLILASGSRLKTPPIPGFEHSFNVDTFQGAVLLDDHLRRLSEFRFPSKALRTVVVVGASFTGLEVVTSLPERLRSSGQTGISFDLILCDRGSSIAPEYSSEGRMVISRQLEKEGIRFLAEEEVDSIAPDRIIFKSGTCIETSTVIWCGGMEASPLTSLFPGDRDRLGRLRVDRFLRMDAQETLFAAGDVALAAVDDEGHDSVMSCQHAIPQGKFAGHNAVNALFGIGLIPYSQPRYGTCLDLGTDQALLTSGWKRIPKMTGASAKELKTEILTQWIIPDLDVEETIKGSVPLILRNE